MPWKSSDPADALLDAVDDRQLGVALLGLLEQPLRLVEQARVLQRDAHARDQSTAAAGSRLAPKAFSRSRSSMTTTPTTRSPPTIGTSGSTARVRCPAADAAASRYLGRRVAEDDGRGPCVTSFQRRLRRGVTGGIVDARAVLDLVQEVNAVARGVVVPADADGPSMRSTSRSLSPTRSTMAWKSSSSRRCPAGCC